MPKNKHKFGVACKPIHKNRDRCDEEVISGKLKVIGNAKRLLTYNHLPTTYYLFQIFVCLAILMVPTHVWAALTSISVDAAGDSIFRGGSDRVLITFNR